jgi:shikimate kinase
VWLDLPLAEVIDRLPADGRRPLAADREQLERLYAARRLAYQQAHLRLDASGARVGDLVEQVVAALDV